MLSRSNFVALCLVAIGVFAIGSPAILRSRAQARVSYCQDNLRRLAVAANSYVGAQGALPPLAWWKADGLKRDDIYDPESPYTNIFDSVPGESADITSQNWAIMLLGQLDTGEAPPQYANGGLISAQGNEELRLMTVRCFVCPSDEFCRPGNVYKRSLSDGSAPTYYARGNYAMNGGTSAMVPAPGDSASPCGDGYHYEYDVTNHAFRMWGNGAGGINKSFTRRAFARGVSNTILLDEIRTGLTEDDSRGVWSLGQIGGSITFAHGVYGDAGGPNPTALNADDVAGCTKVFYVVGEEAIRRENMGCVKRVVGGEANVQAASRSKHVGGVNVAMVDGSVRFVPDEVDALAWHAMHARDLVEHDAALRASRWLERDADRNDVTRNDVTAKTAATGVGGGIDMIENTLAMQFVFIPGGEFNMGAPDIGSGPQDGFAEHTVRLSKGYLMGACEVTREQFEAVMGHTPDLSGYLDEEDAATMPVTNVSWREADEFCARLGELVGEKAAKRWYRLPTEAEWEWACREGSSRRYKYLDDEKERKQLGYNGGYADALPLRAVASYPANALGLYDMRGNVYEFVSDWFKLGYYDTSPRVDPTGPYEGPFVLKAVRGADWVLNGIECKSPAQIMSPDSRNPFVGFRVVCETKSDDGL